MPAPALLAECARLIASVTAWDAGGLTQLHQWQLWVELEGAPPDARQRLPGPLRLRCREAMQGAPVHPSGLQRAVGRALDAVRPGFAEEVVDERTGYSLDLALVSERVAVEVDGPSHFLAPDGRGARAPNGATRLKRRLLRAAGWRLVSVPFYEWDDASARGAGEDEDDVRRRQREYLGGALLREETGKFE